MKRIWVAALAGVVVLAITSSYAVAAKKPKKPAKVTRVATDTYELGAYGVAGQFPTRNCADKIGCVQFQAEPTERFVRIDIKDMTGQPPLGQVEVDGELLAFFCGTSERPVQIPPGAEITVWVFSSAAPFYACGIAAGTATTGEVVATFSNIP